MSKADKIFIDMCVDILKNGTSTEGEKVRPVWEDGSKAYTIKKFGVVNRYDLSEEFPALTLRKTPAKSATDEMLWIWQQKSNDIHELHSGVWDEWADEEGTIGKAYGYQMSVKHKYKDIDDAGMRKAFPGIKLIVRNTGTDDAGNKYDNVFYFREYVEQEELNKIEEETKAFSACTKDARVLAVEKKTEKVWYVNQVDHVIYDLINNPFSRRIMTSLYNHHDLSEMALYPCAYSMTFNVTTKLPNGKEPKSGRLVLNGILNQRSQDILAANNWNVVQYSVLLHMLARHCNMEVGEFVHVIADAHIYDRHIPMIKELISREPLPAPKFWLNPDKKDFYSFTRDDVKMIDYEAGQQIKNIPIAV